MNNIRVRDTTPPTIKRSELIRKRKWFSWYAAWVLLFMGVVGSIVAGNGGWVNVLSGKFTYAGTIGAILAQTILTGIQWSMPDHKALVYLSRALDAVLTFVGYGPLVLISTTGILVTLGIPFQYAYYYACGIIYMVAVIVAWYPEFRLVGNV